LSLLLVSGFSLPLKAQTNQPPTVDKPNTQNNAEGELISLQITASDVDDCGGLNYQATNLPDGLVIDPGTGVISGTIAQAVPGGVAGAFIESNGLIILEAETDFVDQAGGFDLFTENGADYLRASTNHFGNTNGQTVLYHLQITNPGVYRLQMKSDITGTNTTEENDSWLRIVNTADIHFFCVQGGALSSTIEFENILAGGATSKTIYYPKGNAMGRTDHVNENPGNSGFFKAYRSGGGGNKWNLRTIDNNGFPMYAYFPNAGTFTFELGERSAGHKVDRLALTHLDLVATGVPTATLDGSASQQAVAGTPGAAVNSPYNVSISVTDDCVPPISSVINFDWIVNANTFPVELLDLQVQWQAGQRLLTWITASETDNDYFEIQRSANGVDFDPIGRVEGAGNSQERQYYSFYDPYTSSAPNLYYRLLQVDFDGKATHSDIVQLRGALISGSNFYLYPNPSQTLTHIQLKNGAPPAGLFHLQLFAMDGRLVFEERVESSELVGAYPIKLAQYPRGAYLLKLIDPLEEASQKLLLVQ
ncbi:MAG: putative Ig domain-containing protein, partial [Bacteroidota bacterium]